MIDLTIGFSIYCQPEMLSLWLERFNAEPIEARRRVEVVVVDDCGTPEVGRIDAERFRVFRVEKDIHWNQPGARNLIAHVANSERLMLIDPDMTMAEGMLQKLIDAALTLKPGRCFRPILRYEANGKFETTSPNVHLILREDFNRIGGYDEDYCGNKGYSDVQLLRIMEKALKVETRKDLWWWFHHLQPHIPDAQVMNLNRDVSHNKKIHVQKMGLLGRIGWENFVKQTQGKKLRFPWKQQS